MYHYTPGLLGEEVVVQRDEAARAARRQARLDRVARRDRLAQPLPQHRSQLQALSPAGRRAVLLFPNQSARALFDPERARGRREPRGTKCLRVSGRGGGAASGQGRGATAATTSIFRKSTGAGHEEKRRRAETTERKRQKTLREESLSLLAPTDPSASLLSGAASPADHGRGSLLRARRRYETADPSLDPDRAALRRAAADAARAADAAAASRAADSARVAAEKEAARLAHEEWERTRFKHLVEPDKMRLRLRDAYRLRRGSWIAAPPRRRRG